MSYSTMQEPASSHHFRIILKTISTELRINVKGTPFTVKKALPLLRDGASIILTSAGMPAFNIYSASKAAIRNFARDWIVDLEPRRIRVNVLIPGSTSTPDWYPIGSDRRIPSGDGGRRVRSGPSWTYGRTGRNCQRGLYSRRTRAVMSMGPNFMRTGGAGQI
jgi:NAD(P)-dependent dehydrogenase (short-subunit alcohol dehydrogenase family)